MAAETRVIDRSLVIARGQRVVTGWIPIHRVQLACEAPMAMGDVNEALQKVIHNGAGSWPPPVGYWLDDGQTFCLTDGRHEWVARIMRGQRELFVAWVDQLPVSSEGPS